MTVYTDFKLNWDLGKDQAVRCHSNADLLLSHTGDIVTTATEGEYILQKIYLFLSIAKGELPNRPDIGSTFKKYFFKKATPNTMALLQRELMFDLSAQIPELGVKNVEVSALRTNTNGVADAIAVKIKTASDTFNLDATGSDLLAIDFPEAFQSKV